MTTPQMMQPGLHTAIGPQRKKQAQRLTFIRNRLALLAVFHNNGTIRRNIDPSC